MSNRLNEIGELDFQSPKIGSQVIYSNALKKETGKYVHEIFLSINTPHEISAYSESGIIVFNQDSINWKIENNEITIFNREIVDCLEFFGRQLQAQYIEYTFNCENPSQIEFIVGTNTRPDLSRPYRFIKELARSFRMHVAELDRCA